VPEQVQRGIDLARDVDGSRREGLERDVAWRRAAPRPGKVECDDAGAVREGGTEGLEERSTAAEAVQAQERGAGVAPPLDRYSLRHAKTSR
jgi:hypothetical protein